MMESLIVFAERESDIGSNRFGDRAFQGLAYVPARPESVPSRVPRFCRTGHPKAGLLPGPAGFTPDFPWIPYIAGFLPFPPVLAPGSNLGPFLMASSLGSRLKS